MFKELLDLAPFTTYWPMYTLVFFTIGIYFVLFIRKAFRFLYRNVLKNFVTLIFSPTRYFKEETQSYAFIVYLLFIPFVASTFIYIYNIVQFPYYPLFVVIPCHIIYHAHNLYVVTRTPSSLTRY